MMKRYALTLALLTIAAGCATAQDEWSTHIRCDVSQVDSGLPDLTVLEGTTPRLSLDLYNRGQRQAPPSGSYAVVQFAPSATNTSYVITTNSATGSYSYTVQLPQIATNTTDTGAWWYTAQFYASGYRYWTGSGDLTITETTANGTNLQWQTIADTPSCAEVTNIVQAEINTYSNYVDDTYLPLAGGDLYGPVAYTNASGSAVALQARTADPAIAWYGTAGGSADAQLTYDVSLDRMASIGPTNWYWGNARMSGIEDPTAAQDAATKAYVDASSTTVPPDTWAFASDAEALSIYGISYGGNVYYFGPARSFKNGTAAIVHANMMGCSDAAYSNLVVESCVSHVGNTPGETTSQQLLLMDQSVPSTLTDCGSVVSDPLGASAGNFCQSWTNTYAVGSSGRIQFRWIGASSSTVTQDVYAVSWRYKWILP